jgi:hypothetical protein
VPFNIVHSTDTSLSFDAFYSDEFGVTNSSTNISDPTNSARIGIHKNRFTVATSSGTLVTERSKNTSESLLPNQANPHFNAKLISAYKQTQIPTPDSKPPYDDRHSVQMYFSDAIVDAVAKGSAITINVTILYAVGTELNRHGIRSVFEKRTNFQAIILVPGTEPPRDPGRWGIAVSDDQIKTLIKKHFTKDIAYNVKVLAAFSTGGCGLHQTLLHNLIQIDKVERVVYFDCLYENQCAATPASQAIKALKAKAPRAKIIVYKTSEGGNDFVRDSNFTRLTVPSANPALFNTLGIISNLFQQTNYISLVCFRILEAAEKDRIVAIPKGWTKAFNDLSAAVAPNPRGSFISNKVAYNYIYGGGTSKPPTGKTYFEDWAKSNQTVLSAFSRNLGSIKAVDSVRYLLWNNEVPGWPGGDGEEKHDLLIPEFGWEYLAL